MPFTFLKDLSAVTRGMSLVFAVAAIIASGNFSFIFLRQSIVLVIISSSIYKISTSLKNSWIFFITSSSVVSKQSNSIFVIKERKIRSSVPSIKSEIFFSPLKKYITELVSSKKPDISIPFFPEFFLVFQAINLFFEYTLETGKVFSFVCDLFQNGYKQFCIFNRRHRIFINNSTVFIVCLYSFKHDISPPNII